MDARKRHPNIACLPDGSYPRYRLLLHWQEPTVNEQTIVEHLGRLLEEIAGPIVLVWDGLPSHRSKRV